MDIIFSQTHWVVDIQKGIVATLRQYHFCFMFTVSQKKVNL